MERFWKTIDDLGIPRKVLDGLVIEGSRRGWRISTPELDKIPKTPNDSYGLLAVRESGKPTSFFLRAFHKHIRKTVKVNLDELEVLLSNGQVEKESESGWVLITFDGVPIGCGHSNGKILKLEMPKDDIKRMTAGLNNLLASKK